LQIVLRILTAFTDIITNRLPCSIMTNEEAKNLITKYNEGKCTDEEIALLEEWYNRLNEETPELADEQLSEFREESQSQLPGQKIRKIRSTRHLSSIAALLFLFIGNYLYFRHDTPKPEQLLANEIQPGSNRAFLTLPNGKKIELSIAKTGIIAGGQEISYSDGTPLETSENIPGMQTISTPRGGQYQLIFKDGTQIWLNAGSTISFQTTSSSLAPREVTLSGEAYFEVAKDKNRPFKVHSDHQVIEVLGTHFNVSAYKEDKRTRTTLLEGSVRLNNKTILKPCEEATLPSALNALNALNAHNAGISVRKVDPDIAVAWKNGEFMFFKEPLSEILPKLSRWYDVEIIYQNKDLEKRRFGGTISKFESVGEVLDMLKLTGELNYKIDGRRIIIMP
jgi:transmembrane sensor